MSYPRSTSGGGSFVGSEPAMGRGSFVDDPAERDGTSGRREAVEPAPLAGERLKPPRLFTYAEIAEVAKANHMPFLVAQDIAARVALGEAIRYERERGGRFSRLEAAKARLAILTHQLEKEERL
jgi:hypothetical protein